MMASTFWLKLYYEILDDPKMGMLSDHLYRRVIELLLLAGKNGQKGLLPELNSMAWILHVSPADLLVDLGEIQKTGIVTETAEGWLVTKFAERQAPIPDAERKMGQRDREKKQHYHGEVTELSRNVTQIPDIDKEQEEDADREPEPEATATPLVVGGGPVLAGSGNITVQNIKMMQRYGIGEPVRSELLRLGHVNPEMIEYHCRNAPSIGAAIVRIRGDWEIPKAAVRVSEFEAFIQR